jgi:hypothetical protein
MTGDKMSNPRTQETEMLDVVVTATERARKISVVEINTAQDAMINMRIDWEDLQSCLRNRKIDGFEPAVNTMIQLAATTLAMAANLQAKIINQRTQQLMQLDDDVVDMVIKPKDKLAATKAGKQRKKKAIK